MIPRLAVDEAPPPYYERGFWCMCIAERETEAETEAVLVRMAERKGLTLVAVSVQAYEYPNASAYVPLMRIMIGFGAKHGD